MQKLKKEHKSLKIMDTNIFKNSKEKLSLGEHFGFKDKNALGKSSG